MVSGEREERAGNGRSKVQRSRRVGRARMEAILNSMGDGVFIVGSDFRVEFANLALRAELGDGQGKLCTEFFSNDPSFCRQCQLEMSSFGPEMSHGWHSPVTGKDYEMTVSPIHEPDGSVSRLHILRDMSPRTALEAQAQEHLQTLQTKVEEQAEILLRRERLTLLGEISAGLAHEIRTPLGAILTGIKLLEKENLDSEEKMTILRLLYRETVRLEGKLSEFLAYARSRPPMPASTDLGTLLQDLVAVLRANEDLLASVTIRTALRPDPCQWSLDSDQMKEALLNLCMNALQAMQGEGALSLEARCGEDALEIFVRDTGPGIGRDSLPHIFKPFYSRRPEGTGLGLSICKEIIESHGGRISVSSFPGHGTTFRIRLPRPSP